MFQSRRVRSAAVALALYGSLAVGLAPTAGAGDNDCADLVKTYQRKSSNYALISNHCDKGIRARAVVNNWKDTGCYFMSPGSTREFRTGGSFSPRASSGREC